VTLDLGSDLPAFQALGIPLILLVDMKKTFSFVVILLFGAVNAFAGVRYDANTWRGVQTFDVRALSKDLASHNRQLVAVKFNFRGKDIRHLKPNWYQGSIWQPDPDKKGRFTNVRVMVAKADLAAFKSFPTEGALSAPELTLYGRVERDVEANFLFIRLVGRSATVDANGNATVSW
jgi:hypothetical protein